ncbi:tRNA (uridine(34)/cytosine(34)/5-carboxymethylaminomethyluridine(34)-2'-O)-methyltransferase TrmL [Pseudomonas sp. F1_0610]|uniref:tRNA (uridine(34)/cytosine(34)/5- carboxymethylaminomethyluridine(34)-2'-O)- methyltransferase TrmL n=1 Tax=Pseudomonas sp. F1_0610 TaxID=3114284 RepID=UPI0039C49CEB
MFNIILFEPEIPPNTGNIIRLCANTGCALHLVEPLGFRLEDKQLRRAGLDYREFAEVKVHANLDACLAQLGETRLFAFSTKASHSYADVQYQVGDSFIFGPETRGLPQEVRDSIPHEQLVRLPMLEGSRSLNLSNSVAIAVYEAWRQHGFGSHP